MFHKNISEACKDSCSVSTNKELLMFVVFGGSGAKLLLGDHVVSGPENKVWGAT